MLQKKITYTDFDGNKRTEDFYFHLTKADLTDMQMSEVGGLEKRLRGIIQAQDGVRVMEFFKGILHKSYGVKSPDGRRFIKNEEVWNDFCQTEAYSQLFMELVTDADKMADFIKGIIPSDLAEQVDEKMKETGNDLLSVVE